MRVESDAKFEEKLAVGFKNDMTNLVNFNASSGKSENLHFDVPLLSIAYIKFQLKSAEVLSLMTLIISENLYFDGIFLGKVCNI